MNKQRYIALLQDPSSLSKEDIPDLEELIAQYPYCQNAHILLAKIQSDNGSMHAAKLSRKAALYTSDRTKLKHLLSNKQSFAQPVVKIISVEEKPLPLVEEKPLPLVEKEPALLSDVPAVLPTEDITSATTPEETVQEARSENIPVQTIPSVSNTDETIKPILSDVKKEADKHALTFLEELDKNIQELRESRARAAGLLPPFTKEEVEKLNTKSTSEATQTADLIEHIVDASPTEDIAENLPEFPANTKEEEKSPIPSLVFPSIPKPDAISKNDVLDLILSFDDRVKDYFDISQYTKNPVSQDDPSIQTLEPVSNDNSISDFFSIKDWKLEESRMEESSSTQDNNLLLNYLDYIREQKSKKQAPDKKKEKSIISRFIQKDPTISPLSQNQANSKEEEDADEDEKSSIMGNFVSETFALLLEKQGKTEKAIQVYEELILKYPEKKSYFAVRIEELKKKSNLQ